VSAFKARLKWPVIIVLFRVEITTIPLVAQHGTTVTTIPSDAGFCINKSEEETKSLLAFDRYA